MSTRTNIVLKIGKTTTYLYRHMDGYLAETGADLLDKALLAQGTPEYRRTACGAAGEFLRSLLTACYDGTSYDPRPRPIYDVTSDLHGDIEHVYVVTFAERAGKALPVSIKHAARARADEGDAWMSRTTSYTVESFRDLVNADRVACNQRLAVLQASSKHYADCQPYAMV